MIGSSAISRIIMFGTSHESFVLRHATLDAPVYASISRLTRWLRRQIVNSKAEMSTDALGQTTNPHRRNLSCLGLETTGLP